MILPRLSNAAARAHFLDRHGLAGAPAGPGRGDDLSEVIRALGFVQVDSVNTLARAHDLILWSRRPRYRPPQLDRLLAGRRVFEHWTHDAAVLPIEAFPHWRLKFDRDRAHLDRRWPNWRREGWHHRMDDVLKRIAAHGPLTSAEVGEGEEKGRGGWWDWHPSKTALEYLWRSGELSITRREGFRKVYDLTERVIPPEWLDRRAEPGETVDWAMAGALDRLGFATTAELRAFHDLVTPAEAKAWAEAALAEGRIVEMEVETAEGGVRRCLARPGLAEAPVPEAAGRVRVLSPFDPALRDRARAERLFDFRYRIEIFVPAERRRYGYYVFPVWEGLRAIGRIDMKREEGCLAVRAFWPERGVGMGQARRRRLVAELERVARLGGCGDLRFEAGWVRG
ncbi:winged helix-turn-helix domain-containing protein [Histidinibacterium lentulum]|uniref:Winged helix-turn-helix domain-containing protein n=1 Tax=Histidinibacterium lentulum TaxID=2480588 RepID=A0A3N2R0Q5_9RHOB|nr:crosslink repair DNA glycosylase YcaQ family protein [Histidinibacterium lentulum]ROU01059.1 winged helix-turn-helix domain-containing protein [Histidinibacterium lentulum]